MRKSIFVLPLLLMISGLSAQTVETIPFRAVLSNTNEVPPAPAAATGAATVLVHVVRDASGAIVSGSIDANVSYRFPGEVTITAMHIHNAAAGVNGSIVVPFDLTRKDDATGVGTLPKTQAQFPSSSITLATVNALLANPENFYYNVHTATSPGGAIRGQMQRAELTVRMGLMRPQNEFPPITDQNVSGIGTVTSIITRDGAGKPTSALVTFDVSYTGFAPDTTFTGLHIHLGPAGFNGPVTINTGLRSEPGDPSGSGTLRYEVEADVTLTNVLASLESLVFNPAATYINLHTSVFPGGVIRSQMLSTDKMSFQVTLTPANEVPPIVGLNASTPSVIDVYTVRNPDGTVAGGAVIFDSNPRFPSGTVFSGMHIHDRVAGDNGPVTIDSFLGSSPQMVADGTGNIYRVAQVRTAAGLNALNSLIVNPERHYHNLHTTANPGGATRAQLATARTLAPRVTFVESGVQDPSLTTLAPGGLALIVGTDFTKVATNLDGFNAHTAYPTSLNGVQVTIGGVRAPLSFVSPDRIFAQVPFETATGSQPIIVTNADGSSAPFNATVASVAPAIFIYQGGAVAVKSTDSSLIGAGNAARAGDTVVLYATGLGQTTPALPTGGIAVDRIYNTADVTARVGGVNAQVTQSTAIPGFVGVYAVTLRIPNGVAAGNSPVLLQMGTRTSNVSSIAIQ